MTKITIKQVIEQVLGDAPFEFTGMWLCYSVKELMLESRRYPMDGTILRQLRRMRKDGVIDYNVTDQDNSVYFYKGSSNEFVS